LEAASGVQPAAKPAEPEAPQVVSEPEPAPAPPPRKKDTKAASAKKKPAQAAESESLGAEPVVLVPPSQAGAPETNALASSEPISQQGGGTQPAAPSKKKTILDLFRGSDGGSDNAPTQSTSEPEAQVAALPPAKPQPAKQAAKPAAPAPEPEPQVQASAPANGYVIQLSSFRSEGEARSEYGRLAALYPTVVGNLPQRINQTKVGGSTRYQLGLGPVGSRGDATRVCSALFSAGEADCIVRGP
jgi:hypothetical protein